MTTTAAGLISVDKKGGTVLFLDPVTLDTLAVLDGFPPRPHELLVLPETGRAYVPIFGDGIHGDNPHPGDRIAVIDIAERRHVADIALAPLAAPHTLRRGPGGHLYVTCEDSGVVAIVSLADHTVIGTIETGSTNSHRLEIAPDGRRLYTENEEDRSVTVIDPAARKRLRMIDTPHPLAGLAVTPDSRHVLAVSDAEPVVFRIDPEAARVAETIPLEGLTAPAQIARYAPDFSRLAITSMAGDTVTLMAPDLSAQTTVPVGHQPLDMTFHEGALYVACQGDGTIHRIDLATARPTGTFPAGTGCETLSFF